MRAERAQHHDNPHRKDKEEEEAWHTMGASLTHGLVLMFTMTEA